MDSKQHKSFKYRIYPTKKQKKLLCLQLEECRWLYNQFLEQRKLAWSSNGTGLHLYSQISTISSLKMDRPGLNEVHSQVLQNVAVRVDLAYKAFFRRVKLKETPGFPRFKGECYDSFTYPQSGFAIVNGTKPKLRLSKIGNVKIILHRRIEGIIKSLNIKRSPVGKWYACFACEVDKTLLSILNNNVGIDVGIKSFAHLSNNMVIENPKFMKVDKKKLKVASRKLSTTTNTVVKEKRRIIRAKIHERIANRRSNFTHQQSRMIVNNYGFIAIEDLTINRMVHNNCLAKDIHDAAWSQFFDKLIYKAECAGRTVVKVNPAYTSQTCSNCGHRNIMELKDRDFSCSCCGFEIDRDLNAALNILTVGLHSIGHP